MIGRSSWHAWLERHLFHLATAGDEGIELCHGYRSSGHTWQDSARTAATTLSEINAREIT